MPQSDVLLVIPDAHLRKTFDLYNFLRKPYNCLLLSEFDNTRLSFVYGRQVEKINHATPELFKETMDAVATKYEDRRLVYTPVTEVGISLFLYYKSRSEHGHWYYSLPDAENFELARNKYELKNSNENQSSFLKTNVKRPAQP